MSSKSTGPVPPITETSPARRRGPFHQRMHRNPALAATTKIFVTVVGTLVLVAGVVMMVTPGPGIVGIIVGLAILSTEYEWAARWLHKARRKAHEARVRAEEMDPKVRRRRLLVSGVAFLVVFGTVAVLVTAYGWPDVAVTGWNWVQSALGWAPELPGM